MDDARWRQVDALLGEVLEVGADQRDAFLNQKCGGDDELKQAVQRMVALEAEAGGFLDGSIATPVAAREPEPSGVLDGTRVGPYRLLQPLGHGGMGSVYLARREDDYEQEVAIKLVRQDLMNEEIRRRFHKERQALARLEHPNIARLYDGGTTADGYPYLVLERVEGLPIDEFCDQHQLTIRQRLELFRQVCTAVEYAHHHSLVHCDLKPSNILVTADGVPKLLDFGIAKLLRSGQLDDENTLTRVGTRPVTPGYASPEQVLGEPITVVSDVYSLGVILYRLLCGHPPYRVTGSSQLALESMRPGQPRTPSRRVLEPLTLRGEDIDPNGLGQLRSTTPQELARQLRGDLDAIVLKALRKEPKGRYPTVDALASDVLCHLEVQPVSARRGVWRYRTSRFLHRLILPPDAGRRRERLFWTAAFAGVLIAVFAFFQVYPSVYPSVEPLSEAPLLDGSSASRHLADARAAREDSAYQLQRHAANRAVHAARADGDSASEAAGLVLEAQALDVLGQPTEADKALADAYAIFKRLDDRLGLARAVFALRNASDIGRLPITFEEALEIFRQHGDREGEALALVRLGKRVPHEEHKRGEAMIFEALTLARELGNLRTQAEAWSNLASLNYGVEEIQLADEQFAKAVQAARESGDDSLVAGFLFNYSRTRQILGDWVAYDTLIEEAVAISRRIGHRYLLARGLPRLADGRRRIGDESATALYREGLEIALELGDPRVLGTSMVAWASDLGRQGKHAEALQQWQRLLDMYKTAADPQQAAAAEAGVALCLLRLGRAAEAEARLRALAEQYSMEEKPQEYTALLVRLRLAENMLAQVKLEEARDLMTAVLPWVLKNEDVSLHRIATKIAAETDKAREDSTLADLVVTEEIRARQAGDIELALQIRLDMGRMSWYAGDLSGAEAHFDQVQADAVGPVHAWIGRVAVIEAEELARNAY